MAERPNKSKVFKFYIHDGVDAFRLELLGCFTGSEVPEIRGCWQTAKTVLGNRKLVVDVRKLESADEAAREWLATLPTETLNALPGDDPPAKKAATHRRFGTLLRVLRIAEAGSSTPAQ